MGRIASLGLVVALALASSARAAIVTQWDFNSNPADANTGTGTLTPAIGSGTALNVGGTTSSFASGDASGGSSDPAAGDDSGWGLTTWPAQGTNDETAGAQFLSSTAGYQDITISWDQRHSNTGSRYVSLYYTIDGSNWTRLALTAGNASAGVTPVGGNPVSTAGLFGPNGTLSAFDGTQTGAGDDWFNGRSVNLTGVAGVDNNPLFGVRIVASQGGTGSYAASSGGTYGTAGTWRFDMVTISGNAVPEPGTLGLLLVGAFAAIRRRRA